MNISAYFQTILIFFYPTKVRFWSQVCKINLDIFLHLLHRRDGDKYIRVVRVGENTFKIDQQLAVVARGKQRSILIEWCFDFTVIIWKGQPIFIRSNISKLSSEKILIKDKRSSNFIKKKEKYNQIISKMKVIIKYWLIIN